MLLLDAGTVYRIVATWIEWVSNWTLLIRHVDTVDIVVSIFLLICGTTHSRPHSSWNIIVAKLSFSTLSSCSLLAARCSLLLPLHSPWCPLSSCYHPAFVIFLAAYFGAHAVNIVPAWLLFLPEFCSCCGICALPVRVRHDKMGFFNFHSCPGECDSLCLARLCAFKLILCMIES